MSTHTQPFLPLDDDAAQQRAILRDARNDAARKEQRLIRGKRMDVFQAMSRMQSVGLTMAEMAAMSGRGIHCWTQPFTDLRDWGVIVATNERRGGGTVHRLRESVKVKPDGSWE